MLSTFCSLVDVGSFFFYGQKMYVVFYVSPQLSSGNPVYEKYYKQVRCHFKRYFYDLLS